MPGLPETLRNDIRIAKDRDKRRRHTSPWGFHFLDSLLVVGKAGVAAAAAAVVQL